MEDASTPAASRTMSYTVSPPPVVPNPFQSAAFASTEETTTEKVSQRVLGGGMCGDMEWRMDGHGMRSPHLDMHVSLAMHSSCGMFSCSLLASCSCSRLVSCSRCCCTTCHETLHTITGCCCGTWRCRTRRICQSVWYAGTQLCTDGSSHTG